MYPFTKYPYYIYKANNLLISEPYLPQKPQKPIKEKNVLPYIGGVLFVVFILTIPVLGILSIGLVIYGLIIETSTKEERYSCKMNRYVLEKQEYEKSLSDYYDDVSNFDSIKNQSKLEFIYDYRKRKQVILSSERTKRGLLEESFEKDLIKEFGSRIFVNKKIEDMFYPDFFYQDSDIMIDIEIDEPYDFVTKEPIHFRGADDYRDGFMNAHGVYVIRFSEEQIAKFPTCCIDYIRESINLFKNFPLNMIEPDFKNRIARWNYDDAYHFSESNYRKSYLTNN